jgi:uroporphyrinogen-III decarboxylase
MAATMDKDRPMDSRQRVIRAMRRQTPDRIPIDLSWGMTQGMLEKFREHAGDADPAEFEHYPFPAFDETWRWQRASEQTRKFQERGLCVDGGLLLGPTHMLEPEVPWVNLLAFIDTVREYGIY